jgi:hypothetical protein
VSCTLLVPLVPSLDPLGALLGPCGVVLVALVAQSSRHYMGITKFVEDGGKVRPSGSWSARRALLGPLASLWGPQRSSLRGSKRPPKKPQEAPKMPEGGPWAAKGRQEAPKSAKKSPAGPQ